MDELIKINENEDGITTVSARDLHEFLEVGRDFSSWIKGRVEKYQFIEGEDFIIDSPISVNQTGRGGDRRTKDYHISIDMAKELSMVENNERGREARQYFIVREKQAKALESILPDFTNPAIAARAWADQYDKREIAEEKVSLLESTVEIMKPKEEFYDAVTNSTDAITMKQVADVLAIPGFGRNKLFAFLRNKKVLTKDNQPYRAYVDRGYFRMIEQRYSDIYGEVHVNLKTVVYQSGLDFIRKLVEKENN